MLRTDTGRREASSLADFKDTTHSYSISGPRLTAEKDLALLADVLETMDRLEPSHATMSQPDKAPFYLLTGVVKGELSATDIRKLNVSGPRSPSSSN